jgi:RNA polymerase II elongation factor ELL
MIVRMTAETLDALQANPRMEFTFGPEPVRLLLISPSIHSPRLQGISIGDAFFPVRSAKENYPHDLYLRASSAAKPMAPLKLYANITGEFTVTIQNQIRAPTVTAETKKNPRVATMLPGPPPGVSSSQTTKKGKSSGKAQSATSAFLKPIPQPRPSASTSPLPPATPSPLRTAVVKALALKKRSFDELVRLVENDGEKGKRELVELLNQVSLPPSTCLGSPDPSSDR